MALAKTILALAPLIIKARSRRPSKQLAGVALSLACMAFSGAFLLAASFVWMMKKYGAEFGFLVVGLVFFLCAVILHFASRSQKEEPKVSNVASKQDPLSQYFPDELQHDPHILGLTKTINENPMGSTAAAVSLGFILSRQIIGD